MKTKHAILTAALAFSLTVITPTGTHAATIYVSSDQDNAIRTFTPGGVGSAFVTDPGDQSVLSSPEGLAFDTAGHLYVANSGNNTIMKVTPGGAGSVFANTGLSNREGIAFDGVGNLFVGNYVENLGTFGDFTIMKFTPDGIGSLFATTGGRGLAFDNAGNLFVTSGRDSIDKFTPDGVGSLFANNTIFPNYTLDAVVGLAFDSAGNLYALNSDNGNIVKFPPGGGRSNFVYGGDGPTYTAFEPDPVPEPATLGLLAVS